MKLSKNARRKKKKIYICVYGGIVSDVYAERDRSDPEPEAVVLDVDEERDDAGLIGKLWDEIEADPAYERVPAEFYAPLDEAEDSDEGGKR